MKKRVAVLCIVVLVSLLLPTSVLADASPTTRAEFLTTYPHAVGQLYGYVHLGGYAAHEAPLTLAGYSYQLSASVDGLYADPEDVTVDVADADFYIDFSGDHLPKEICLSVIATDFDGVYLSGIAFSLSINGGTWQSYVTAAGFDGNDYLILETAGVSRIHIRNDHNSEYIGISYMALLPKDPQTAPAAPVVAGKTDTTVTLETITGAEYKAGDGAWQSSPAFTGLSPATEYTFYARLAETATHFASPSSPGTAVTTDKSAQAAPAAPVVASKTDTTVTLETIAGAEYKVGDGAWQSNPAFTGLSPATEYTFYARLAETATLLASPSSPGTAATTDKSAQAAPAAPVVAGKTDTTVTLETITGAEYKAGDGAWQSSPAFTGLSPATEYTFYARLAETTTHFASPGSPGTAVTTDKSAQAAPAAPVVASKTDTTVTLETIAGAEYKVGDGAWQSSPAFTGLSPATDYTCYARLAETTTHFASPGSPGTAVTTDKSAQAAPAAPVVASKTEASVTLAAVAGAEYKVGDGAWQSSPVFTGLLPATEYTFYIRLAETATLSASADSDGTAVTTLAAEDIPATGEKPEILSLMLVVFALAAAIAIRRKVVRQI